jgi:predicted ATPase
VEAVHIQLPVSPRPLIGWAREVDEIRRLFVEDGARLVTLSGPGGVGTTRLALAVAALLEPEFEAGVRFVDLAPVSDASLVPHIREKLGLRSRAEIAAWGVRYGLA